MTTVYVSNNNFWWQASLDQWIAFLQGNIDGSIIEWDLSEYFAALESAPDNAIAPCSLLGFTAVSKTDVVAHGIGDWWDEDYESALREACKISKEA